MEPQVNEIWRTRSGNLVLIVRQLDHDYLIRKAGGKPDDFGDDGPLRMLWYDDVDNTWNISLLMNRLQAKTDMTFADMVRVVM